MRSARQHCQDQCFGVGADVACLAGEPLWRPFRVPPMRAGHVVRQRSMTLTAISARMRRDERAAMEYLDDARRGAGVDLLADQRVRHGIEELVDLDMIVDADARNAPLCILIVLLGQLLHDRRFDCFEQLAAADAEAAHLTTVHSLKRRSDRVIAFC